VQRQSPPQTVFNLGSSQRQSQSQSPNFPPPQFGGFRPIKRHLQVNQDEIFAEDLQLAQDRSRRHKNKKNKNGKKSGPADTIKPRNKSEQRKADLAKQKEKQQDRESRLHSARHKMQEALNNELAKVYYEEFLQKNNAVDYYDDDYFYDDELEPDYYYYYYYDYE